MRERLARAIEVGSIPLCALGVVGMMVCAWNSGPPLSVREKTPGEWAFVAGMAVCVVPVVFFAPVHAAWRESLATGIRGGVRRASGLAPSIDRAGLRRSLLWVGAAVVVAVTAGVVNLVTGFSARYPAVGFVPLVIIGVCLWRAGRWWSRAVS